MDKNKSRIVASVVLVLSLGCGAAVFADGQVGDDRSFSRLDDFSYLGSFVSSTNQWAAGTGWDVSFRKTWLQYFATSLDYQNDAHFPGHHRDGITAEVWVPVSFFSDHVTTLSAGVGPFYYFDTTTAANPYGFADNHGLAWMYSLDATVLMWNRGDGTGPFVEARFDHTSPSKSIETNSWELGLGYRAFSDFDGGYGFSASDGAPQYEIAGYAYKTVVNSLTPEDSRAEEIEGRWHIWNVLKLSAGILNEGNSQLIRRNGFESELWAEPGFFSDTVSVGAGVGFYTALDKYRPAPGPHLSGIVSADISWRFLKHWGLDGPDLHFLWHRIVTDYNRDTDIVLWGFGYRF